MIHRINHFRFIVTIAALCFLAALTACASNSTSGDEATETQYISTHDQLPTCDGISEPYFTASPIDIGLLGTDFKNISPLGSTNPPARHVFAADHIYFCFKDDETAMNVYAPGNATLTSIVRYNYDYDEDGELDDGEADYTLYFSPCNQFKTSFSHVKTLESAFSDAIGEFTEDDCTPTSCTKEVAIDISAGQLLGTSGNRPGHQCLDFGTYDARLSDLQFISPERYFGATLGYIQARCPLNYYDSSTAPYTTLQNYVGHYNADADTFTRRSDEPLCGVHMPDIAGAAKGNWWPDTTSMQEDIEASCVALLDNNITPSTRQKFSIGTDAMSGLASNDYTFTKEDSGRVNRNFDDVSEDGNIYCYDTFDIYGADFIFLVKISDGNLSIEAKDFDDCDSYDPDPSAWSFTSPSTFYR